MTWSEHVPAGSCLLLTLALTGGGDDLLEWCGDDDELQPDWLSPVNGADGSYTGVDIAGLRPGGQYKVTATVREGELSEDVLEPYAEMKHLRSPVLELAPPNRVDGAPAPPNNVGAHVTGPDRVRLNWSDNSRNETGFEIWLRQWSGDDAEPVWRRQGNSLPAGTVSAEVSGLSVEEILSVGFTEVPTVLRGRYSLLVVAHNSSGFSASERFDLEFLPGPHPPPSLPGKVPACLPRPTGLEVGGYHVFACFERPDGAAVRAWDYRLGSDESGLFYLFSRENVEVLVKVLDGCAYNGHRWVFVAPVTDLGFKLELRELSLVEAVWRYDRDNPGRGAGFFAGNPKGRRARAVSDTEAIPCSAAEIAAAARASGAGGDSALLPPVAPAPPTSSRAFLNAGEGTDCEPGGPALTVSGGYRVSLCYETANGLVGDALDWGLDSTHSGLLYFFNRDNVEILIKVLDGCGVNGHRWVFVAPVTDLAFNLQVEGPGGPPWTHTNRLSNTAETKSDTSAFACTPEA